MEEVTLEHGDSGGAGEGVAAVVIVTSPIFGGGDGGFGAGESTNAHRGRRKGKTELQGRTGRVEVAASVGQFQGEVEVGLGWPSEL